MPSMQFEWDPDKARANRSKHRLSFEEASKLFESDLDVLEIYDAEHSENEDRFIAIGPIERGVIAVVHTERRENVIRILSARMATPSECEQFAAYWRGRDE